MTPTVRLGVTGLARSGKTVFITALVRNLVAGGRLPYFAAMAEGRIARAYLEPQPDDSVPRFAYEEHLAELASDPPQWPESTRRISQLRVTIEYTPATALRRALGTGRLHVDIVDYPGEWLIDLPLLELSLRRLVGAAVAEAKAPHRAAAARAWLAFLSTLDADAPADEQMALTGAAALHALSAGGARTRCAADGAGSGPLPAAGRPRRLAPADLLSAAAAGRVRLRARLAGRHAGAPLRELQDARRAAVLPRSLRPPRPADRADRRAVGRSTPGRRAGSTCSAPWRASCAASVPAPTRWLSTILARRASTGCCSPPPRPTICTTPATTGSRRSCVCWPTRPSRGPRSPAPR